MMVLEREAGGDIRLVSDEKSVSKAISWEKGIHTWSEVV